VFIVRQDQGCQFQFCLDSIPLVTTVLLVKRLFLVHPVVFALKARDSLVPEVDMVRRNDNRRLIVVDCV
jgi:hypothetical protein